MVVFSTPTVKVRERLSYHLRHIRQREPITLSLLICFLRLSLHSYNSPHFSLWLISLSSNSHLSTSAVSTSLLLSCLLLPFISPQDKKVKGGGGPSLSCLLIACPSLAFFESWLHSLSPLKLHLYSAPPLLSPLISYRSLSFSLSVWASWQAVWGCAVLGQLSMAKLQ